ncbi:MAG: hypothetical protein LBI01_03135 [Elusimicrobium sp.]|jgi:hypothetical protein|nr:hypothetical protein [Elusimicrobium sp.]
MNENKAGNFFIELGAVFNPKGFDEADARTNQTAANVSKSFDNLSAKTSSYGANMSRIIGGGSKISAGYMQSFFDISSKGFLNLESLTKNIFGNMLSSFTGMIAQMLSSAAMSGVTGLFGGGGLLGGLLGSRKTGGPIAETGPYLLHAGEYVLPSDVVSSIKQGAAPAGADGGGISAGGAVNITLNTPVTVNGSASQIDARELAEEISAAVRRGAAWAVEHAKINYKIGRQKNGEVSL